MAMVRKNCLVCGSTFDGIPRRLHCSTSCSRRAAKSRRRERDAAGVSWADGNVAECCGWCFGPMPDMTGQKGSPSHKFCGAECRDAAAMHRASHPEVACVVDYKACVECSGVFIERPLARHQLFCSQQCKNRTKNAKKPRMARSCEWCGGGYETRNKSQRSCSPTCGQRLWKSERPGGWVCEIPPPHRCVHCGLLVPGRRQRKYCGLWCSEAAIGRRPDRVDVVIGDCIVCGLAFVSPTYRGKLTCTSRCSKRETRSRRKQDKKGLASASLRRKVLERDGWRCHLCGKKIPDRPFKARPNDATVDHLIPRSAGGGNEMSNLAAAHFMCNSKRCTAGAAQLRLIA